MVRQVWGMYRRAYDGLPREIWMLSGALFVNRFGTMVLPFLALYLTRDLGYSEAAAGRMLSIYGLGSIAGSYTAGRVIDRFGSVRLLIVFLLLSVPAFLVVPWCETWWALAISIFTLSFFTDGSRPANATAIAEFAPKELQIRAFGLQRMALNLGVSFGPAIGGFLATIGFVWLFVADAATTLLCAICLIGFFGWRRPAEREASGGSPATPKLAASPLKDAQFVTFVGLILMVSAIFFQIHVAYPLFLQDRYGLSEPAIGLIFAVNTVVIVLFEMLLLNAVQRFSHLKVIACGALLSCLGFGMLPFGSSIGFCVLSMLVITLGEMLWMPLASGWVARRSQRGKQGSYMGWYVLTYSVAGLLAPTLGGVAYQRDPSLIWYLGIGIGAVAAAGFLGLRAWEQRSEARGGEPAGASDRLAISAPLHSEAGNLGSAALEAPAPLE